MQPMNLAQGLFATILLVAFLVACRDNREQRTWQTPINGVTLVQLDERGTNGLSGSASDLYVELNVGGRTQRELVLHGLYLTIDRITWAQSGTATICLNGGYTSKFYNQVTLDNHEAHKSYDLHFSLADECPLEGSISP
jgi:hypothetical protein